VGELECGRGLLRQSIGLGCTSRPGAGRVGVGFPLSPMVCAGPGPQCAASQRLRYLSRVERRPLAAGAAGHGSDEGAGGEHGQAFLRHGVKVDGRL